MKTFETSLDEYTKEEIEKNGNGVYGGKRHDEICDYLEETFGFDESQINDISMGVWMGIESERRVKQEEIDRLKKQNEILRECVEFVLRYYQNDDVGDKAKEALAKLDAMEGEV